MDKLMQWIKAHLPTQRRLIQLYAALLYNAHARGFITGNIYTGNIKAMCVPGLNCYSCPGAVGACPLGALQNALASSPQRAPVYVLGILMLFGLTLGRTICGFLCPVGLVQGLLHKIPTPKVQKGRVTRALSWVKYIILAVFVVILPLWNSIKGLPLPAFCKYICPAGTLEGAVGLLSHPANAEKLSMLGQLFTGKFVIMVLIALACVFVYRAFCRFLCPLGAIYGLFARLTVLGVKVEPARCIDCGKCTGCCPMDIRRVGDRECIHCMRCVEECPTGAIAFKAGRITLCGKDQPVPRKKRLAAWCAALVLLLGVAALVNQPAEETAPTPPAAETLATGQEVGMLAPDFTVPLYGGGSFTLSERRGQTVVVNFWATWCGPCVEELPHFDKLHRQGDVMVVAVHSHLVTDDVPAYLARHDYALPFALDETGSVIASFGGSTMLPHTVVIAPNGVITYNAPGSLTEEELLKLVE